MSLNLNYSLSFIMHQLVLTEQSASPQKRKQTFTMLICGMVGKTLFSIASFLNMFFPKSSGKYLHGDVHT